MIWQEPKECTSLKGITENVVIILLNMMISDLFSSLCVEWNLVASVYVLLIHQHHLRSRDFDFILRKNITT